MTPTDKAAIEGLLDAIRADTALQPTIVNKEFLIAEKARTAEQALQRLLAGETREAVGELREHEGRISFHTLVPIEKLKAGLLYSSPSPHDDAAYGPPREIYSRIAFEAIAAAQKECGVKLIPFDEEDAIEFMERIDEHLESAIGEGELPPPYELTHDDAGADKPTGVKP